MRTACRPAVFVPTPHAADLDHTCFSRWAVAGPDDILRLGLLDPGGVNLYPAADISQAKRAIQPPIA